MRALNTATLTETGLLSFLGKTSLENAKLTVRQYLKHLFIVAQIVSLPNTPLTSSMAKSCYEGSPNSHSMAKSGEIDISCGKAKYSVIPASSATPSSSAVAAETPTNCPVSLDCSILSSLLTQTHIRPNIPQTEPTTIRRNGARTTNATGSVQTKGFNRFHFSPGQGFVLIRAVLRHTCQPAHCRDVWGYLTVSVLVYPNLKLTMIAKNERKVLQLM